MIHERSRETRRGEVGTEPTRSDAAACEPNWKKDNNRNMPAAVRVSEGLSWREGEARRQQNAFAKVELNAPSENGRPNCNQRMRQFISRLSLAI